MFVCDPICVKQNYLTLKINFVQVSMYIIFKYLNIQTFQLTFYGMQCGLNKYIKTFQLFITYLFFFYLIFYLFINLFFVPIQNLQPNDCLPFYVIFQVKCSVRARYCNDSESSDYIHSEEFFAGIKVSQHIYCRLTCLFSYLLFYFCLGLQNINIIYTFKGTNKNICFFHIWIHFL